MWWKPKSMASARFAIESSGNKRQNRASSVTNVALMKDSAMPIIEPLAIVSGHSECRSLDETIPVLSHVLALEVVDRSDQQITMRHPNTGWLLVVHQGDPDAPDKPERNHFGVRVSNNQEVDRAYQYLCAKKGELQLKKVVKRKERQGSYSLFFMEPGGNYWEIESYENRAKSGLPRDVAFPWKQPFVSDEFSARGYTPQAFTHGTIECVDLAESVKFYQDGLGLNVITHVPGVIPHDIQHPDLPWYVVSLQVPAHKHKLLGPLQRFTITVASAGKLAEAHEKFQASRNEFGISRITDIEDQAGGPSFMLSDRDQNWWEIAYQSN